MSSFSNHQQQSRFLANASAAKDNHWTTDTATAKSKQKQPDDESKGTKPNTPSALTPTSSNGPGGLQPSTNPLKYTWIFWFRQQRAPGNKIVSYEEGIKKISTFSSVEQFWSLYTHLNPPSALTPTTDYLLFHSGVLRPVWEDPFNLSGGKWIIRLKKGVSDRLWEDLVLAVLGEQFDDLQPPGDEEKDEWPGICGCTISVRPNEDIISVWNRYEADTKVREKIKETIKRVLNLPPTCLLEYKTNNDSMQDKSSFRTTPIIDRQ